MQETLFKKSPEEIEEEYKRNTFLITLKNGKYPQRKGLGNRLWLLAIGDRESAPLNDLKTYLNQHPKSWANKKILSFYRNSYSHPCIASNEFYALASHRVRDVFEKYIGSCICSHHTNRISFLFDKTNLINWGLMDHDLKEKYPKNYRIDKRGFVHYRY